MRVSSSPPTIIPALTAVLAIAGGTLSGQGVASAPGAMPMALQSTAEAGAQPSPPARPCLEDDEFSAFDFWLGTWDVHTADGELAGTNVITAVESGCALHEQWTGVSGGTGSSINYLDRVTDQWVQVWNSEGGAQISIRGGMTEDGMLLEGHIHYVGRGETFPFRGLWTPLEDGRVRQFFEQSDDNGETWAPWFEGFYTQRNPIERSD